jgi:hypothetical protein
MVVVVVIVGGWAKFRKLRKTRKDKRAHISAIAICDLIEPDVVVQVVQDHHRRILCPAQSAELPVLLL